MLRVLVVEENEVDFLFCANLLDTEHPGRFKIIHARTHIDAMVLAENREFHVILLDLATRPGGAKSIRRLRRLAGDTPIVALAPLDTAPSGVLHVIDKRTLLRAGLGDILIRAARPHAQAGGAT